MLGTAISREEARQQKTMMPPEMAPEERTVSATSWEMTSEELASWRIDRSCLDDTLSLASRESVTSR